MLEYSRTQAVDIWNEITVERAERFSIEISGVDSDHIPTTIDPVTGESPHLLLAALRRAFELSGETLTPVKVTCRNNIPISSGFGSSVRYKQRVRVVTALIAPRPQCPYCLGPPLSPPQSATIVGGLIAGLVMTGNELKVGDSFPSDGDGKHNEELLQLANEIEGHPDNVAPAIYGGIQVIRECKSREAARPPGWERRRWPVAASNRPPSSPIVSFFRRAPHGRRGLAPLRTAAASCATTSTPRTRCRSAS